ncbi:hypothetical protein GC209_10770 [bacterium]|nr:hypothetical protein [bacterium]
MNGASKILTVSYGTFSCTLEGFDDPFNTMKAIAEYFRDLAAEDRYFGAEPPTPDAAMLHRIAEREIQRRVEAKIGEHGVILRADEAVTPKVSFPATRSAEPAPQAAPLPGMAPQAPAPVLSSPSQAAPAIESAAARLSRLRAAQAHAAVTPPPAAISFVDAYGEDQDMAPPVPAMAPAPMPFVTPMDPAPATAAAEPQPAEQPPAAQDAEAAKAAARDLRKARKAKLAAEEAPAGSPPPVGTAPSAPMPAEAAAEPVMATELAATAAKSDDMAADLASDEPEALLDAIALRLAQSAPEAEAGPAVQGLAHEADPKAALDDLALSIRETLAGIGSADDQLVADIADAAPMAAAAPEAPDAFVDDLPELADLAGQEDEAAEEAAALNLAATALPELEPEQPDHIAAIAELAVDPAEVAPEFAQPDAALPEKGEAGAELSAASVAEVVTDFVPEKIQRARARVIKIRRIDAQPGVEAAEGPADSSTDKDASPVLSPEAEADLQHELAALEAELGAKPTQTPAEPAAGAVVHAEPHRLTGAETDEASVSRLMEKAQTEADVPESKRRRSAIAHLKAAVLATVAERRINPNGRKPDERIDPYRKDLDQVVRPPVSDRPAPLVLVSSQRIDRKPEATPNAAAPRAAQLATSQPSPQPAAEPLPSVSVANIRPRRVTAGNQALSSSVEDEEDLMPDDMANVFANSGKQSFQDFADSLGVTSMAELIEAAGAYYTLVLGQDNFTRPQLFEQISSIPGQDDVSREDSLRGFGRLLRDGRLTKTVRGKYALADNSPILTEARRHVS